MADLAEVEQALVKLISQAAYPNGVDQPSVAGCDIAVFQGWPKFEALSAALDAGHVQISVFPRPDERVTLTVSSTGPNRAGSSERCAHCRGRRFRLCRSGCRCGARHRGGAGKTHPGETARVLCGCSDLNPQCTPADCARGHDGRVYTGATPATHDVPNHRVVEASRSTGLCGRANRYGPCGPVPFSAAGRHDGPAALSPQRPERRMAEAAALPARFVL